MNEASGVIRKETPTFYFIGVTTRKSSIMKVFPLWIDLIAALLGHKLKPTEDA